MLYLLMLCTNDYLILLTCLHGVDLLLSLSSDHFSLKFNSQGPKRYSVTSVWYSELLLQQVIPAFKERQCLWTTVFMQDGETPNIEFNIKELLHAKIGPRNHVIYRDISDARSTRSLDLNSLISGCGNSEKELGL